MDKGTIIAPQSEAIEAGTIALKRGGKITWRMPVIRPAPDF